MQTKIVRKRAFSSFDSKVEVSDGLVQVTKDRKKLDKAIVLLLIRHAVGKLLTVNEIVDIFNNSHTHQVKPSHVRHSLNQLKRDTKGILRFGAWKGVGVQPQAIHALGKVKYR